MPFLDERGKPYQYMAIRYEITARKRSEDRLREQEALARVGQMAAVVAHELKNPIAGIRGALQVIGSRMAADARDKPIIGEIIARLDALNRIVQDLLVFARPCELRAEPTDLQALVVTTVDHLKRDPSLSAVAIDVSGQAAVVNVDAEQLQLAVQNVLMNAAQAMNGSGAIHVEITRDGANWTISVADTDPGMPAEVKAKAFEPFFHHSQPRHRPRPADRPACPRSTPRRYHRRHPGGRRHSRVDVAAGDVLNARPVRKFRHDGREFSRLLRRSPAPAAVSGE